MRARRQLVALALVAVTVACGEVFSAPVATHRGLALALAWPAEPGASAVFGAGIDSVYALVGRADESIAAEVTVPFPAGHEAIKVSLDVPVRQKYETLYVYVELRDGPSTLFYASSQVVATERALPSVPPLQLYYIGPGFNAASVAITPRISFMSANLSAQLTATAYDVQGAPVPAPIGWSVSDPRFASVTSAGVLTAKNVAGTFWVRALTPTGVGDILNVTVTTTPQLSAPTNGGR